GRPTVREQHVVDRRQRAAPVLFTRGMEAVRVAEDAVHPRLVDRAPPRDAVAIGVEAGARVLGERVDDVAVAPAALVLERLRQITVIERDERLDAVLEQRVDQAVVVLEAARLAVASAAREEPRPREREAVRVHAEPREQVDVLAPAAVVVAGERAEVAALPGEAIPDGGAAAVGVERTLDLERRGRRAPEKAVGEALHRPSASASSQ